jgi:fructose/tagatose bisphosphate aldolase
MASSIHDILNSLDNSLKIEKGEVRVSNIARFRQLVYKLAEISVIDTGEKQALARYLTRAAAQYMGIIPASIHNLYMARGNGEISMSFAIPALNLRVLTFDAAKAVFRAAKKIGTNAVILEIARSEIGYTDQRPAEFATSVLAAAITEGYKGPVFLQGDHFQVSAKRYAVDAEGEIDALKALMREAISAGFFNIDIDTSTLVDLAQTSVPAQQVLNTQLSAMYTTYIRTIQPQGVTISIGGEIGEVGGHNSTDEELRAYLNGYNAALNNQITGIIGLSKISIQTGTSHGGIVLPDGSIASVDVDFDTMQRLSRIARREFQLGGAVQHGASTLPLSAFGKFVEAEACEVHLATNFMNLFYEHAPDELKKEIYSFLRSKFDMERKPGMTDDQFYYKTRKNAIGPFKKQIWGLPSSFKEEMGTIWEEQFTHIFTNLGLQETHKHVDCTIDLPEVQPNFKVYMGESANIEAVSDLAD